MKNCRQFRLASYHVFCTFDMLFVFPTFFQDDTSAGEAAAPPSLQSMLAFLDAEDSGQLVLACQLCPGRCIS